MDEEPFNPDHAESLNEQEAFPAQASLLMNESQQTPPEKKPNHTPEMVEGIWLTVRYYGGAFSFFAVIAFLLMMIGLGRGIGISNALGAFFTGIYFSMIFVVPIWLFITLFLVCVTLFSRKVYMTLGVLIVTGCSLLLTGAFCAGVPLLALSMHTR